MSCCFTHVVSNLKCFKPREILMKKKLQTLGIIIQSMSIKTYVSNLNNPFHTGFFNLCNIDILVQIFFFFRNCLGNCRMFRSMAHLNQFDANSNPLVVTTKMYLDIINICHRETSCLVEKHSLMLYLLTY